MDQSVDPKSVSMTMIPTGDSDLTIRLMGRLDAFSTGSIWREAVDGVKERKWQQVIVEAGEVDYIDGAGIGLLVQLMTIQTQGGDRVDIRGLRPEFRRLLEMFDPSLFAYTHTENIEKKSFFEIIGQASVKLFSDMKKLVSFVGEIIAALSSALARPSSIRWKDVYLVAEKAGFDALPIIILIGFLMGLIMSFQSAVTLQRFGAELFVANLLGLSMFRELGPLMTSILLASRSGSAFAAEIGTMKINDELKALTTMGLNPVSFLAVPRVIAAVSMTPLLTLFFIFSSLVGGAVVMLSMGYPLTAYTSRIFSSLNMADFLGGMIKAVIFSIFVAGIACHRGIITKIGASAVGESTTSAVVSGIILIAVVDGVFAVIYYCLGI